MLVAVLALFWHPPPLPCHPIYCYYVILNNIYNNNRYGLVVVVVLVVAPKINILHLSGELQGVGVGGWWVQTFHDIQ